MEGDSASDVFVLSKLNVSPTKTQCVCRRQSFLCISFRFQHRHCNNAEYCSTLLDFFDILLFCIQTEVWIAFLLSLSTDEGLICGG